MLLLDGLLALLLPGCSLTPPAPFFPEATPLPQAVQRSKEAARYRSVNEAFSKIDAKTVKVWIDRWTSSDGRVSATVPKAVRIDTAALMRRHPAWLLAAALENGAVAPDAPEIARVLAVASPAFSPARPQGSSFVPVTSVPARSIRDPFNGQAARRRQSDALDSFFSSATARDNLRGRDEAYLARRNLEDAITSAQRGAVSELDLTLIPPDVALRLTNLRLQLLRSLSRTPAQRAAARQEIRAIQAQFNELWRQQTDLQAARLREATIDLPARLRREGQARIETESRREAEARNMARLDVEREAKRDLRADFATPVPDLRLVLPATRRVGNMAARPEAGGTNFFETTPPALPSSRNRERQVLASPSRFDPQVVAALRDKARLEARQWANLVAAQLGSRWDNSPSNPDRTAAALSILFPGSTR